MLASESHSRAYSLSVWSDSPFTMQLVATDRVATPPASTQLPVDCRHIP